MIQITYLSHGKLAKGELDTLEKIRSEVWVDCFNPSKPELKKIAEKTDISYEDLLRALDEDERPGIHGIDKVSGVTFHAPFLNKANNYVTVPIGIFINGNRIVIIRTRHIEAIEKLELLDDGKKVEMLQKDITFTMYMILSEVVNHFFRVTDELEERIDKIEDAVFKTHGQKTVKEIFSLKKTLIYFHKSLTGNREVIASIEKKFIKDLKGPNVKKIRYLYSDVIQLIDMIATYRDILTGTLDIHLTSVSNNLNEIVKRLTVVASFVMVPTLISGIYGMNFKYMPEIHKWGVYGYPFALGLMGLSIVLMYIYFKRKKWL